MDEVDLWLPNGNSINHDRNKPKFMSYQTNTDNIYPEGSYITAKENPSMQLKIVAYKQRIYYCAVVGNEGRKKLAYFERELVPPVS